MTGDIFKFFLFLYWIFTIVGFIVYTLNYEKINSEENEFTIDPIYFLIPMANIFNLLFTISIIFEHYKELKKNKESIKEKYKMTKKYPQLNSLNVLKEIFETITFSSNVNEEEDNINKPMSAQEFKQMITFLKSNYQKDEYSQLLIKYEFSFIKLISIFKESNTIENKISEDILIPSNKLLRQFLNKVEEARKSIEKNELIEKEKKLNIDIETKDKTKERFINEINEEIKFHENL
jgi:hypothetical protein